MDCLTWKSLNDEHEFRFGFRHVRLSVSWRGPHCAGGWVWVASAWKNQKCFSHVSHHCERHMHDSILRTGGVMKSYQQIQGLTHHAETRLIEFVQNFGNGERLGWKTAYIACLRVLEDNLNCASQHLSWELPVADSADGCAHTFTAELDDLIIVSTDDDVFAAPLMPDKWALIDDAQGDSEGADPACPASHPRGVQQ